MIVEVQPTSPAIEHLSFKTLRADSDSAAVNLSSSKEVLNGARVVHGGILTAPLDSAMGHAVCEGRGDLIASTISLSVSFLALARRDIKVTRRGRRTVFATAEVHGADGTILAEALDCFKIMKEQTEISGNPYGMSV
ncbi:PaaI family thioesterase [Primorskyibacter flagellatus]|uniref:Uncharacterized domain 1-containing protein n=1 Tax=Primorskyibacter flagellatus TaxID=1387277 RepID=A0A1W2DVT3_9RHOB|nr:PaaI family thioesterase [Primorskyibacter flagellatus]SMD01560.1 uncharacterized domain 1-containing protein [Primorskyibacter flagellatus]